MPKKSDKTFDSSNLSSILNNLNTAIFRTSIDGRFVDVNPAFLKVFGFSNKSELADLNAIDLYENPEERSRMREELLSKGLFKEREIVFKRKDGELFPARVSSVLVLENSDQPAYIDGVVDDITQQKQKLEALKASERKNRTMADAVSEAVIFFQDGFSIESNRSAVQMFGYTNVEFEHLDLNELFVKDDVITFGKLCRHEEAESTRLTAKRQNGTTLPVECIVRSFDYQGQKAQMTTLVDLSRQEAALAQLQQRQEELMVSHRIIVENESRYRSLVENSPTGILRIDLQGNILDVNQRMLDILGSPNVEATKAFNMFTFKPIQDAGITQKFQVAIRDNCTVGYEGEYTSTWGRTLHFKTVISPVHDAEQKIIGAQANMEDITDTYLAQQAKHKIERDQLEERNIFMAGPIMILKWDMAADRPLLYASDNVKNILGYSVLEFLQGDIIFSEIIHPDDLERSRVAAQNALESGQDTFDTGAYRIRRKDGTYLWVNDHSTVIRDTQGEPKNITGIIYDISHMIEAEEELKLTEQTYQEIFNSISEAVFIQDPDTFEILDVNETVLRMYGYTRDEVLAGDVQKFSAQSDVMPKVTELFEMARETGQATAEWEAKHKSGERFWVEVTLRPATIHGKKRMLANVRDISDRKKILSELEVSLREQEALLREVHHRVKNNMQVISSLLNLQAEFTQDEHLFEIFGETQNRIRTMALIHEKLFRSKSMTDVDFNSYLQSLIFDLINFYSIDQQRIHIHQDIAKMRLDITKAIPCGLIVNELVTNVFKYAFPDNREGTIWLSVRALEDGEAEIQVRDNGIGLDASIDFETTQTMGLRIIRILTEQLAGTMELDHSQGTSFTLRFNLGIHN